MALSVNTNVMSLNAQRNLSTTNSSLAISLQRLSSGLRVNSAKDDAAGLFSAERMQADIRALNQSVRNAADGISLAQTAEGALAQVANNLQRIREIAIQASNATIEDPSGLQAEVDELTAEIQRIVDSTSFAGQQLLDGSVGDLEFQVGADDTAANQITISSGTFDVGSLNASGAAGTVNVSTQAAAQSALTDLDADIDSVSQTRATFGAVQNRFEAVISNLQNYSENLSAARGRIVDADFAAETANFTRTQILQQAGVSMLAQANSQPQIALALLQ